MLFDDMPRLTSSLSDSSLMLIWQNDERLRRKHDLISINGADAVTL